jgi:demethylmenaquinone methyltransferase/2-methoxy-6-polyprenyl-1,4-benzoquinol methylase
MIQKYKEHRNFFDLKALEYNLSDIDKIKTEEIIKSVDFSRDHIVLDIGCGKGALFPILKKFNPNLKIIGIDLSFKMLINNRHKDFPTSQGISEYLPIKSNSTDAIINFCVFPHIIHKETALQEFHRVLKLNGRYYIIHPNGREQINNLHKGIGNPVNNDFLLTIKEIEELLSANRFVLKTKVDNNDKFFLEAIKI